MLFYFPSCNFTADHPELSKRIVRYVRENFSASVAGCCRPGHQKPSAGDTALTVCTTCGIILRETRKDIKEMNLVSLIAGLADFPYPDYTGASVVVQDCFKARGCDDLFDAVRTVLRRMNIEIIEQPLNRNLTEFCGVFRFNPMLEKNKEIAPGYFDGDVKPFLLPCDKEEQKRRLAAHAAPYAGKKIVCYCNSCLNGLKQAGADAVHLLELLFQ